MEAQRSAAEIGNVFCEKGVIMAKTRNEEVSPEARRDGLEEMRTLAAGVLLANAKIEGLQQHLNDRLQEDICSVIRKELETHLRPLLSEVHTVKQAYETLERRVEEKFGAVESVVQTHLEQTAQLVQGLSQDLSELKPMLVQCQQDIAAQAGQHQTNHLEVMTKISEVVLKLNALDASLAEVKKLIPEVNNLQSKLREVASEVGKLPDLKAQVVSLRAICYETKNRVDQVYWYCNNLLSQICKKIDDLYRLFVPPKQGQSQR